MKQFVFPAWVEKSPAFLCLYLGPTLAVGAASDRIAHKAAGIVAAELDAQGPFWRASAPVRTAGGWECRDLGGRYASADDAKRAAEQAILEAGDGRYIAPLPSNTISVTPDGSIQMQGRLLDGDAELQDAVAEVARLVHERSATAALDETTEALRRILRAPTCDGPQQ